MHGRVRVGVCPGVAFKKWGVFFPVIAIAATHSLVLNVFWSLDFSYTWAEPGGWRAAPGTAYLKHVGSKATVQLACPKVDRFWSVPVCTHPPKHAQLSSGKGVKSTCS